MWLTIAGEEAVAAARQGDEKEAVFKNCAPFTDCIS